MDFDLALTGFEAAEIDIVLDAASDKTADAGPEDPQPEHSAAPPVSASRSSPAHLWRCLRASVLRDPHGR